MEEFVYIGNGQTVPKDVVSVRFDPSVTEVEEEAFINCRCLREVLLNEGLKKIRRYAFGVCTSLRSISLPSTVTEVGEEAFWNCTNLREVVLNNGLKAIGRSVFAGCFGALESITLPFTLTEIGMHAFRNCSSLREVELHEYLETIGRNAFLHCSSLERLTFPTISTRLNNVVKVETEVNRARQLNEIDAILGDMIVRNGSELFVPGAVIRRAVADDGSNWNTAKASLDQIVIWIKYYEIKEATSLFELALWKARLDQEEAPTSREAYRIEVPGPIKNAILQYLG